jgi:hypothetical protein
MQGHAGLGEQRRTRCIAICLLCSKSYCQMLYRYVAVLFSSVLLHVVLYVWLIHRRSCSCFCCLFFYTRPPLWVWASSVMSLDHTRRHHKRWDSSGRVISPSQRLPDSTQHSQGTNIHDPGGILTWNPSKRAAADPRLGPRGHWNRPFVVLHATK